VKLFLGYTTATGHSAQQMTHTSPRKSSQLVEAQVSVLVESFL